MVFTLNGLKPLLRARRHSVSLPCRLSLFSTTPAAPSGHNKWSKIKHGKAINDAQKQATRGVLVKDLTRLSRSHGENPAFNPQLAAVIATAKRAAVPKAVIEAAIARGQGRSVSGVTLKSMSLEVMVPPSVALIVEVETDNKNRLLSDLNVVIKRAKGQLSRTTPFFTRWGRVEFEKTEKFRTIEDLMDIGIEAGAWDINDDEDGILTVWTQPDQTTKVGNAIQEKTCLKLVSSELVWSPNKDTIAKIDRGEEAKALSEMLAALREYPDVRAIHANIERGDLAEEEFGELAECLL